jgi:uncharacterized protein YpuA (DUF1002 family)
MNEKTKKDLIKEMAEKMDAFDTMLVEILEEKGVLTQEEWKKKIKSRIMKAQGVRKY